MQCCRPIENASLYLHGWSQQKDDALGQFPTAWSVCGGHKMVRGRVGNGTNGGVPGTDIYGTQ